MELRARHADVQQTTLLLDLAGHAHRRLARQLLLLDPRQEDRLELEPLRPVQRQQVDSSLSAVVEACAEPLDPLLDRLRAVVELLGELAQPSEVGLTHELALADLVRDRIDQPLLDCDPPHLLGQRAEAGAAQALQQLPCAVAGQQRRPLERNLRVGEQLLEVDRARVQPDQHRHLLIRHALRAQRSHPLEHERALGLGRVEAAQLRFRPLGPRRAQRLLRPAEPRHEPVRQREYLRRGAVVLLQPHDRRPREPRRQPEQPLRRGAGEAVDRLVVVADRAEVVARPEPELE